MDRFHNRLCTGWLMTGLKVSVFDCLNGIPAANRGLLETVEFTLIPYLG
jgi:hypothetical protein